MARLLPFALRHLLPFGLFTAGTSIAWLGLVSLCQGAQLSEYTWTRTILRVKAMSRQRQGDHAVVFIGGSATHFGINAERVSTLLHRPALNNGCHAGLQIPYILWEARQALRPGDVAVICAETNLLLDDDVEDYAVHYIGTQGRDYLASRPLVERLSIEMAMSPTVVGECLWARLKNRPPLYPLPLYNPATVDPFGDETANTLDHRATLSPDIASETVAAALAKGNGISARSRSAIREFVDWCKTRKIRLLYFHPPVKDDPALRRPTTLAGIVRLDHELTSLGITVVGHFEDSLLPASSFLDTPHHLLHEPAMTFSEQVANLIRLTPPRERNGGN